MKALCPKCAGGVEFDSEGGRLSCYFCCDTGEVDAAVAAEFERDAAWACYVAAEKRIVERAALGVPHGWAYYFDEYEGVVMVPPRPAKKLPPGPAWEAVAEEFDDIPF